MTRTMAGGKNSGGTRHISGTQWGCYRPWAGCLRTLEAAWSALSLAGCVSLRVSPKRGWLSDLLPQGVLVVRAQVGAYPHQSQRTAHREASMQCGNYLQRASEGTTPCCSVAHSQELGGQGIQSAFKAKWKWIWRCRAIAFLLFVY